MTEIIHVGHHYEPSHLDLHCLQGICFGLNSPGFIIIIIITFFVSRFSFFFFFFVLFCFCFVIVDFFYISVCLVSVYLTELSFVSDKIRANYCEFTSQVHVYRSVYSLIRPSISYTSV